MRWNLATNEQLITIIKHDNSCPLSLLREAVIEMLNRSMFDALIGDRVHHQYRDLKKTELKQRWDKEDFMQFGRMVVFQAIDTFKPDKGMNFFSYAYLRVGSELSKLKDTQQRKKRNASQMYSLNSKTANGSEFVEFFYDHKINVEKYVVNKVLIEHLLERVNARQRKVVLLRLLGYEGAEIAEIIGEGTPGSISQSYKLAIRKMRRGA